MTLENIFQKKWMPKGKGVEFSCISILALKDTAFHVTKGPQVSPTTANTDKNPAGVNICILYLGAPEGLS